MTTSHKRNVPRKATRSVPPSTEALRRAWRSNLHAGPDRALAACDAVRREWDPFADEERREEVTAEGWETLCPWDFPGDVSAR